MTIDPELLRLIQVEGITDDDYRRVQPKIELIRKMSALSASGLLVFDFFKMNFYYVGENPFGWECVNNDEAMRLGLDFLEYHATSDGWS